MDSLVQDLRHSLRSLRRQRGFALVAIISLSVGIGVNTAIFSVMDALLFKPPALQRLDRSVIVYHRSPGNADQGVSFRAYQHYRERPGIFARSMAITAARPLVLSDGSRRDQIYAEPVTSNFFSMATIRMAHGAPFSSDADRTIEPPLVVVLSHAFWKKRFNADPAVVGSLVTINGQPFTVSGIAGEGFGGFDGELSVDMWMPMTTWATLIHETNRLTSNDQWLTMIGELADGVSLEQARAAMAAAGQAFVIRDGQATDVREAGSSRLSSVPTDGLILVAGAFGIGLIVLALACTNVANLLLARAAERRHEMTVRAALGSGRMRLLRLWVSESLILSAVAAFFGVLVASWLLSTLVAFKPPTYIGQADAPALPFVFSLDYRVLGFALVLTTLSAIAVGLLSGWRSARAALTNDRGAERHFAPGFNLRSAVIAMQMALSTLLLICCALFVRSALRVTDAEPGFDTANVSLLPISQDQKGVKVQKPDQFERDIADRVRRLPGVVAATVMDPVPLWFGGNFASFRIEGAGAQRMGRSRIGLQYFETMRIPMLVGRDFGPNDTATSPRVAIVNETMARRFWPDASAVGQRIDSGDGPVEIVGVVRDSKYQSLSEASQPYVFEPITQEPSNNLSLSLAVRTVGDPAPIHRAIEREVKALVPTWPAFEFRTLDEGLEMQRQLPEIAATLLGSLGLFGLFLAMLGVYGVMAFVVRQRRQELGIRLALGAPVRRVVSMVVKQGMVVCVAGALVGIAAAIGLAQLIASALSGVGAPDLLTSVTVIVVLFTIALLACYLPARAITKISPSSALRSE
jgi:macrolide transport system ATP-binding/permease protein